MFDSYKLRMAARGTYEGESRRKNSQKIMDASWMRDVATKPVFVKWVDSGLPEVDDNDVPVYAKYNAKSYYNITGDEIAYLLQFRLSDLKNRPDIKVGSYVQMMNEMDEPEWWLIWHLDDRNQFRQFSIVKCTHVYRWISGKDGKRVIHESLGCPRNQSSYNSGVWLDYTTQVVENQHIMVIPTNDDSKTITYDTKFLISEPGRYPPLAWKVSKVMPAFNGGITKFTMTQEQFNPATDNAELMVADYYISSVEPSANTSSISKTLSNLEITYSGSPSVRAGGNYKKLTLKTCSDGELIDVVGEVEWTVSFDGNENKLEYIAQDNVFKIKCTNDYSLIGKTFVVTANIENQSTSIIMEVASL